MIAKSKIPIAIEFETGVVGKTPIIRHSLKATALNHIYGEALVTAKALSNNQDPRSITVYACFKSKICDHLAIEEDELDEETVFLIVSEMEAKIDELKKTCITLAVSPSSESKSTGAKTP